MAGVCAYAMEMEAVSKAIAKWLVLIMGNSLVMLWMVRLSGSGPASRATRATLPLTHQPHVPLTAVGFPEKLKQNDIPADGCRDSA